MGQLAKTIYFSDYPKAATGRSGLTVPFPENLRDDYARIAHLSSYSVRELIGFESFALLDEAAKKKAVPTAAFARNLLLNAARPNPERETADYRWALQSTFQGGKGSPLHDWYPYLEGYSPDFVNSIIDIFAPNATSLLDPFCGSGTTALIASTRGLTGYYSEVNPVCQLIIGAKLSAVKMSHSERELLASKLERAAETIRESLTAAKVDQNLKRAFSAAFGDSEFFTPKAFDQVLRLRTLIDIIRTTDTGFAQLFEVAALRSLVPGSLLIRRGDLRFRTPSELVRSRPDFLSALEESLRLVASDLHDTETAPGEAKFICPDARTVSSELAGKVDAIITSPPYLNGTNYFRNTKLELWFLRKLTSKAELRLLRDAAITAGINDVTVRKTNRFRSGDYPAELQETLKRFDGNAYDVRIPLMVEAYFSEMKQVVAGFSGALRKGGVVAIDLGDSCYGSVWVPTDRILAAMMKQEGFELLERIVLRERQSRDGRKLSQTLQVFKLVELKSVRAKGSHKSSSKTRLREWEAFKTDLPHQQGEMAMRNWGNPLHSLCSYQGKLKPSIAHSLVGAIVPREGSLVLDPFSGVGTIPFEAQLSGHSAIGFDISPAALAISKAKLERVEPAAVEQVLQDLEGAISEARLSAAEVTALQTIRFNGPLPDYFNRQTLAQIVAARRHFAANPPDDGSSALVFASLLHILHGNRPYALSRRSHPITPFAPTGDDEYRPLMPRLRAKVTKSLEALMKLPPRTGRAIYQDATQTWPADVQNLDAVITSPPFFDSTRFYSANWMRLWFAGWEAADFQQRPADFVDERQKVSFETYDAIFRQSAERLKLGGLVLLHLGKSKKCDMADALDKVAGRYLKKIDIFTESVEHCESHGIRDKGTVTHHQYLLLERVT